MNFDEIAGWAAYAGWVFTLIWLWLAIRHGDNQYKQFCKVHEKWKKATNHCRHNSLFINNMFPAISYWFTKYRAMRDRAWRQEKELVALKKENARLWLASKRLSE